MGYGHTEQLSHEGLKAKKYRGIRLAFGDPACPDRSEQSKLIDVLRASEIDAEQLAMTHQPRAASASGLYFAHPKAHHFSGLDREGPG